jgi:hypothetical protein
MTVPTESRVICVEDFLILSPVARTWAILSGLLSDIPPFPLRSVQIIAIIVQLVLGGTEFRLIEQRSRNG